MRLVSAPFDALNSSPTEDANDYGPSSSRVQVHVVPSDHPHVPELEDADRQEALVTGECIVREGSSALLLARTPPSTSSILELRYIPLSADLPPASRPHQLLFPAPLLGARLATSTDGLSLVIQACTITAHLFRIRVPIDLLASSSSTILTDDIPPRWVKEQKLSSAGPDVYGSSSAISLSHQSSDLGIHLAACSDGRILKAIWRDTSTEDEVEGTWQESTIRASNFFSGMSRLFSRTNVNGASGPSVDVRDGGSPTHPLGIETFVRSSSSEHTLAISASRDRKLRLWDLSSDACIRVIDLPFNVMMADAPPDNSEDLVVVDGQEARASLPTTAKVIIKAYSSFEHDASSPYPLYFVVFVPTSSLTGGFFALYGVQFDGVHRKGTSGSQAGIMGDVGDVDLLWQKECDIDTRGPHAELRDVTVLPTKDELGTKWRLWSLWDVEGRPLSKYTTVGEDEAETWSTVSTPVFQAALHGSEMDQDLGARMHMMQSGSDMATFFLERILEAGRYTLSTLDKAVTLYADDLEANWPENMTKPPSLAADAEFSGLAEQIASLVGCNVQLEADPASGALGYESYWGAVRREWSRFVGILDDLEAKARWPVGFVDALPTDDVGRDSPFVVSSELLSLPVVEDGGLILERLSSTLAPSRLEVSPALATTLTQALRARLERGRILSQRELDHLLQIARTSNGSAFFHLVGNDADALQGILDIATFAQELFNGLERASTIAFEAALEEAAHTETSLPLETIVSEAWIQHVQAEMAQEEEDTLTSRFQELKVRLNLDSVDGQGLILALLDTLFEGVLGQRDTSMSQVLLRTELGVALASDSLTQLISSRLALVRSLCFLVAAIASDVLSLTTIDVAEIVSRTLMAWQRLVALHSLVSLEGPPETAAEEPVSEVLITGTGAELDADAVANRIDRLGFSENSPSTFIRDVGTGGGVSDDITILDGVAINPLHACLMAGHFFSIEESTQGFALSTAVPAFTSAVLGFDCLFESDTASLGVTRAWAMLAHNLIVVGYPSAAASILARFWPGCASSYLLGRCAVMTGNATEAARHFDDVARTLMSPEQLQDLQGEESDDEGAILISLLPSPIRSALGTTEALVLFYRHVALYMASLSAHGAVARYAKLALDQTELVQGTPSVYSPSLTRDLWFALFRAQLTLGDFESSYTTVMAIPKTLHDLKRDSLRSLIGVMCESGHIAQLLKMSFAGEQAEVERTLSFKARNSDPFTTKPNYYRILYSFYTKRGDLKSAGAVMYQQGTRLGDIRKLAAVVRPRGGRGAGSANAYTLDKEESIDLAILEANCYLAAVNVLALIEPRDAWFADALPRPSREEEEEIAGEEENQASSSVSKRVRNPRTGLTSYIPRSRFASDSHEISIVRLADVRRLCRLCLARLELAPLFPEVALSLDAMSAVLLFARVDEFDKALTLARDMGLDESGVLASLTERCVGLARVEEAKRRGENEANDEDLDSEFEAEEARFLDLSQWSAAWKGRTSSRAWRYLRLQLDLSSSSSTSASSSSPRKAVQGSDGGDKEARCRIAVLDKILSLGAWQSVPKWLVEWFRMKRPDVLVRSLSSHSLIDAALDEALLMVRTSTDGEVSAMERKRAKTAAQSTWLPYLVIDALLVRAEEPSEGGAGGSGSMERREKAGALKKAVRERSDKLNGMERVWRGEVEADEARARRFASSSVQRSSSLSTPMEM